MASDPALQHYRERLITHRLLQNLRIDHTQIIISEEQTGGRITQAGVLILLELYYWLYENGIPRYLDQSMSASTLASYHRTLREHSILVMGDVSDDPLILILGSIIMEGLIKAQWTDSNVIGVGTIMSIFYHKVLFTGPNFQSFINQLSWNIVQYHSSKTIEYQPDGMLIRELGTLSFGRSAMKNEPISEFVEGCLVAVVLYPEIHYRIALRGVPLISKYDSNLEFTADKPTVSAVEQVFEIEKFNIIPYHIMDILVMGIDFADHYTRTIELSNIDKAKGEMSNERIRLPLTTGHFTFHTPQFLQGLLTLTSTIGVTQPWIYLAEAYKDTDDKMVWLDAEYYL